MQLKNNCIPKGLIPLEKLFDQNDVFKSPRIEFDDEEVESCNLGTVAMPKMINISKFLSVDMKHKYIEMMKRFIDFFAWGYANLKKYDLLLFSILFLSKRMRNLSNRNLEGSIHCSCL